MVYLLVAGFSGTNWSETSSSNFCLFRLLTVTVGPSVQSFTSLSWPTNGHITMMEFVGVVKAEIHQGPGQRRQWHVIGTCQRDNLPLGTWTEISMKIFASVIESGLSNKSRVSQFSIWIEKSRSKILNIMSHKKHSANLWLRKKIEGKVSFVTVEKKVLFYGTRQRNALIIWMSLF